MVKALNTLNSWYLFSPRCHSMAPKCTGRAATRSSGSSPPSLGRSWTAVLLSCSPHLLPMLSGPSSPSVLRLPWPNCSNLAAQRPCRAILSRLWALPWHGTSQHHTQKQLRRPQSVTFVLYSQFLVLDWLRDLVHFGPVNEIACSGCAADLRPFCQLPQTHCRSPTV